MKVEIAQITTDPGRFESNTSKIISAIHKAKKDRADIVVFPELTIPGYMSLDLMLNRKYLEENKKRLEEIVSVTTGISCVVGFIDFDKVRVGPDGTPLRHNAAAIIRDGKLIGLEYKTLLPDYDVYDECRYFQSAKERNIYEINGVKIGVEICEDAWDENYPIKVSDELVEKGAELLINISASPFFIGKRLVREKLIKNFIRKHNVPFVYTNLVGGQDGYDGELIFDGQSMVFASDARLIGLGQSFAEDQILIDLDSKKEIQLTVSNSVAELNNALVLGIKEYFRRTGFKKAFIGLSGGIDSAVTASLAVEALSKENVTGISMPSRFSSKGSIDDAKKLAQNLGINFKVMPIEATLKVFEKSLSSEFNGLNRDVTEENIQARIRGMTLMAFANKFKGLVISTGNKTETALGYTTLYGDMCGGLAAIEDVSKLNVYALAHLINTRADREIIPKSIIEKAPSAELREGQTDEESLGLYSQVSPLVDEIIEEDKTRKELLEKYPEDLVDKVLSKIAVAEYKRRQAPPGIKVSKKAFGIGRRVPIAHEFRA